MRKYKDIIVRVREENEFAFNESFYKGWKLVSTLINDEEENVSKVGFVNFFKTCEKEKVFDKIIELDNLIPTFSINFSDEILYFEHKLSYEVLTMW